MRNLNAGFKIDTVVNGEIETNTHIISSLIDNTCVIIDPADGKVISGFIEKHELKPRYIINTHGHYDHISGNRYLKDKYDPLICIGADDAEFLLKPELNMSIYLGHDCKSPMCDIVLKENDHIDFGESRIYVKETPGHTPGSITLVLGNHLFSGDLVFMDGLGRTDLPGGDPEKLVNSVKAFWVLAKIDAMVYPGHGDNGKKILFENGVKEIFLYRY